MPALSKGANVALAGPTGPVSLVRARLEWQRGATGLDGSALLVTASGKVPSDDDFVFFNQPRSPDGSVAHRHENGAEVIEVELARLPPEIDKVVLTASVDAAAPPGSTFATVSGICVTVTDPAGTELASFRPVDLGAETVLILMEFYRRDRTWKVRAVGQGYSAGLAGIARDFGISVSDDSGDAPAAASAPATSPPPAATPSHSPAPTTPPPAAAGATTAFDQGVASLPTEFRVRLEKSTQAARVVLEKRGLTGVVARVALVVDASGSMATLFQRGTVARVVERIMAVAGRFDDDGDMEVWIFATKSKRLPVLTVADLATYPGSHLKISRATGYGNEEPVVIRDILEFYAPGMVMGPPPKRGLPGRRSTKATGAAVDARVGSATTSDAPPVFVVFLSDGGIYRDAQIGQLLIEASRLPIFWQFVGLGSASYGVLERLDGMPGRVVDNAGFFAVDDIDHITDEVLYDRLLSEFPAWLRAARAEGIIP